jgi:outer membrane protein TolC
MDLSLTQSILRGSADGVGHSVREAELNLRVERVRFEKQVEALLLEVDRAYWRLAQAQANVETKTRSLQRAQHQFEVTAENIRRGIQAPGDLYFVEGSLVSFQEQRLRTEERLQLARRTLARLLDLPADSGLRAVDVLDGVDAPIPPGLEATQSPDHQLVVLEANRRALKLRFEENQASTRLDLQATLAIRGDAQNPWDDVLSAQAPDGRVGVVFEFPLAPGPDAARAQKAALEVNRQAGRVNASAQRVQMAAGDLEIRLQGQAKRLGLAQRKVELARKALANAKDEFESGVSTLNEVIRFQEQLDGTIISAQQAIVELRIRRAEFLQAMGALRADLEVRVK